MNVDAHGWLFTPGDRPQRFPRAVASGAEAVILGWVGRAFDASGLTASALGPVPPRHRRNVIAALVIFGAGIVVGIFLDSASPHVGQGRDVTPGQHDQPAGPSVTAVPAVPAASGVMQ